MSRLFRSNSMASMSSRSSLGTIPDIVNEEQKLEFQTDDNVDFGDWNIPKVSSKNIYKKKWSVASFRSECFCKHSHQNKSELIEKMVTITFT